LGGTNTNPAIITKSHQIVDEQWKYP
jgi:hypothetical protein